MNSEKEMQRLLVDLANVESTQVAMEELQGKWPDLRPKIANLPPGLLNAGAPDTIQGVFFLRQILQRLWIGDPDQMEKLERILLPSREEVGVDWKRKTLVYRPKTTVQRALYFLLQNASRAKVCANAECRKPYFIGKRPNERYCTDACFERAQVLAKKTWWDEHGAEWQTHYRSAKSGSGSKTRTYYRSAKSKAQEKK